MTQTYSQEVCAARHGSLHWMLGTLITMQLMCFSWLGYLSVRVINIENASIATAATLTTKVEDMQAQMNRRFDDVMVHIKELKQ